MIKNIHIQDTCIYELMLNNSYGDFGGGLREKNKWSINIQFDSSVSTEEKKEITREIYSAIVGKVDF